MAARIAVIDSGLDYKHKDLVNSLYKNPNETFDLRDEDGNGYQDDVYGWNFAEQNGEVIDYKFLGTFSPDTKKFFDVQGRLMTGAATEEDKAWYKEKAKDQKFIKELGVFGNFVHGTHVAGIAVKNSDNKVFAVKLLPTDTRSFFSTFVEYSKTLKASDSTRWKILTTALEALSKEQVKLMVQVAQFVKMHEARVANGSFGTGLDQARMIGDNLYRIIFFKSPSEQDSIKAATIFLKSSIEEGKKFIGAAPSTLFVFAAGNEGTNNDVELSYPTNIRGDNTISVAATYQNLILAPFSNYGSVVDIAAPGMLINSTIPGDDYLKVSGTSQAAPYVANVAGQIIDANPALTPKDVKNILLSTVDKKSFLKGKVSSEGVVNTERALYAAQLTKSVGVTEAISRSLTQVKDKVPSFVMPDASLKSVIPVPLAPLFTM